MVDQPYSIGSTYIPGLGKLMEELGECVQVGGKIMGTGHMGQHWDGTNLRERLEEEIGDIIAAIYYFCEHNELIDDNAIFDRADEKVRLFEIWHREQNNA